MKIQATKKAILKGYSSVIIAGYCELRDFVREAEKEGMKWQIYQDLRS